MICSVIINLNKNIRTTILKVIKTLGEKNFITFNEEKSPHRTDDDNSEKSDNKKMIRNVKNVF